MATVKGLFSTALQEGMAAAKKVTDPYQKAMAYAALADAMAKTGLVAGSNLDEGEAPEVAETKGKDALKPEANKGKAAPAPTPAAKKEAPTPAPAPAEPELTEEWTDEMLTLKAEGIEFVQKLKEDYEEDALNGCVQQFSEGTMSTLDEITPLNIDAFVAFMQALIAQQ